MKPDGSSVLEADTLFVPRKQRVRHCQGRKINLDSPVGCYMQAIPSPAGLPAEYNSPSCWVGSN